ncbi:MAG: RNA-binding protein [Microcystaceae cyanobacterium]
MNKTMAIGLTSLLLTTLNLSPAQAFFHGGGGSWSASGFRGTASGGDGSWSASGYRGGSASGSDGSWSGTGFRGSTASGGDGSWSASGYRGGSASGGDGSWSGTGFRGGTASGGDGSWSATSSYGATAYGGYDHYYGGTYYGGYHPPTVVNTYSTGCYNCGGWYAAGAAATGALIGATAANVNNANTYAEGYAAGAVNTAYAMGAIYPTLPPGAMLQTIGNATYYLANGVWFSPSYGANGIYYRVVPAP